MSVKAVLQRAFHSAGGLKLVRLRNRARNRLLFYHNFAVSAAAAFDAQCAYLARHYNAVTLDAVCDFMQNGKPLPHNSIAITVDDGYRDFFLHAYPALRRWKIPATVFLMTGFLDGLEWPWWDRLAYAYRLSPLPAVSLQIGEAEPVKQVLAGVAQRKASYEQTAEALKTIPNEQRLTFLRQIPDVFHIHLPPEPPPDLEPLGWHEVRAMADSGITFGAHTVTHPILASLAEDADLRAEIAGSKQRVETQLGREAAHFCYPNGRLQDIGEAAIRMVREADFRTAVCTESGFNVAGVDPFLLRRIAMEPEAAPRYFRQQVAGFRI